MLLWKLIILKGAKMKKKTLICVCVLVIVLGILSGDSLFATKLGTLKDIANPGQIFLNKEQIFLTDQKTKKVHLFKYDGLEYLKLLSKQGTGPGETPYIPLITLTSDYVFIYSLNKGLYYSLNGDYIKEFRIKKRGNGLMPLGQNFVFLTTYVSRNNEKWTDLSICSYSRETDLTPVKTLYLQKYDSSRYTGSKIDYSLINEYFGYRVYNDTLFFGDSSRGFYMEIFNSKGKQIGKINLTQFEKQKVTEQYKNEYLQRIKAEPNYTTAVSMYNFIFPEYFPLYCNFSVDKEKIYFFTYIRKGNDREVIIADWKKGKLLKIAYVPWIIHNYAFTYPVINGKFYYPLENEETEEWELYEAEVK